MKVTILRTTNDCPDIEHCPAQLTVDKHPQRRYVIVNRETDPEILAACATHIGPGEVLGWAEPALFDGGRYL